MHELCMWSQLYETRLTWSTASNVRILSILSTAVWQAFKYFTSWESTDFLNVFKLACWQLDSPLKTNLVSRKPGLSTAAQRGVAWWCGLSVNWPECRKRAELKEMHYKCSHSAFLQTAFEAGMKLIWPTNPPPGGEACVHGQEKAWPSRKLD